MYNLVEELKNIITDFFEKHDYKVTRASSYEDIALTATKQIPGVESTRFEILIVDDMMFADTDEGVEYDTHVDINGFLAQHKVYKGHVSKGEYSADTLAKLTDLLNSEEFERVLGYEFLIPLTIEQRR